MSEHYRFLRPKWMTHVYFAASMLFVAAFVLYLLKGNWIFGCAWLVFAMGWYQRWTWVKENPVFEVNVEHIVAVFGPRRRREIPISEVTAVEREPKRFLVSLRDGSRISLLAARWMGPEGDREKQLARLEALLASAAEKNSTQTAS